MTTLQARAERCAQAVRDTAILPVRCADEVARAYAQAAADVTDADAALDVAAGIVEQRHRSGAYGWPETTRGQRRMLAHRLAGAWLVALGLEPWVSQERQQRDHEDDGDCPECWAPRGMPHTDECPIERRDL